MKRWFTFAVLVSIAGPIAGAQAGVFGNNLIVNGGAESGPGGDGSAAVASVPGWQRTGGCDVYAYAAATKNVQEAIGPTGIVPRGSGSNYFAGGAAEASCTFTLSSPIDLSSGAATIDASNATFAISGYFGGGHSRHDNSTLTVVFQDAGGNSLKSVMIGGVGPDDRAEGFTGLYFRRQIGQVPSGTRKAALTLAMNYVDGIQNEAYADSLALVLSQPAPAESLLGVNLILNPGADASPGQSDGSPIPTSADIPGWVRDAYLTAESYQDTGGDLYQVSGGPADAGGNYFYGGVNVTDQSNPVTTGYQDVDVSSAASLIDAGNVPYALSGWLGGYSGQNDHATLEAQFQRWDGTVISSATIGPVLAADRNNNSSLLHRSTNGVVPAGTRVIHILLSMTRTDGGNNDGLADSLSLVLGSGAGGGNGPEISQTVISASAFGGFDAVMPGTWMEIYGANLAAGSRQWGKSDFNGNVAPTSLDGTSVTVGGQPAFVFYVSPGQVNALVPDIAANGMQPVVVTTANGSSEPYFVGVNPSEPGLLAPGSFVVNGKQYLAALFADGVTFALPTGAISGVTSRPAKPGETIVVYGIGFGAVTPNVPIGQIAEVATQTSPLTVMFGNTPANLNYSGEAPTFVGLYQFNIVVPNISNSDLVPVTFTVNGTSVPQTLYTAVQN